MHDSGIQSSLIYLIGLTGFIRMFIHSIGEPLSNYNSSAIFSKYIYLVYFIQERKKSTFSDFETIEKIQHKSFLFLCGTCISVWASILSIPYLISITNFQTAICLLGINFLIIKLTYKWT